MCCWRSQIGYQFLNCWSTRSTVNVSVCLCKSWALHYGDVMWDISWGKPRAYYILLPTRVRERCNSCDSVSTFGVGPMWCPIHTEEDSQEALAMPIIFYYTGRPRCIFGKSVLPWGGVMVHGPCNANIHFKWGKAVWGLSHFEAVFGFRSFVSCENVNRFHGNINNKIKILGAFQFCSKEWSIAIDRQSTMDEKKRKSEHSI